SKFAMIYAGAQKNMGPSGVTVIIMRNDLIDNAADGLTSMLSYKIHKSKKSLYNTPPTFGIYLLGLVMQWLQDRGGLKGIEAINNEKAQMLYDAIDNLSIYKGTAETKDRSVMNVTWRITPNDLEGKFIAEATEKGLIGLKGHRDVGGCRASIYNAMPIEGIKALVDFMEKFEKENK
ncbi:MAG: 3-phosphoserine/phosphohydroxythreonine transaminase, partial [bacterium]|nr:3-phosphoserine/phosphohydroxythreonine transaminase [bacterium]